jgi:aldehyde:ferredoxin oxidoreductase
MEVGERRLNMLRLFNAREGFNKEQDKLPAKFFKPLEGAGPTGGTALDPVEMETAIDTYYQLMGWTDQGNPTHAKLADLGLAWVA